MKNAMNESNVSTLRQRALEVMGGLGGWTVDGLAAALDIDRPRFAEALREAGFTIVFGLVIR